MSDSKDALRNAIFEYVVLLDNRGVMEDTVGAKTINAVDGFRFIRFRAILRSNIFTLGRPRIENLQIAFTFE